MTSERGSVILKAAAALGASRRILNEFAEKLKHKWTRPVACQCGESESSCLCPLEFIDFDQAESWMRQPVQDGRATNLHLLILALESKFRRPFQIIVSRISSTYNPCIRVFCILLMQERGELIQSFCDAGVVDRDIAEDVRIRIGRLRRELWQWKTHEETETIIQDFEKARRGAIAAELHLHMAENFQGGAYILPFCRYRPINGKGGTASVFEAFIQQDLVKDTKLQQALARSEVTDEKYGTVRTPLNAGRSVYCPNMRG